MSNLQSLARHRWLFRLHAIAMLAMALLLLLLHWLLRNALIATFASIFVLMITGFCLLVAGLVDFGAALEAFLDREAVAWLFLMMAVAGIFLGIFLFVSPTLSVERICLFASFHALALGFLEMRLAKRLRDCKRQQELLRGFASASTPFVVLLLMAGAYGARFGVVVLACYCVFFASELLVLPVRLRRLPPSDLSRSDLPQPI